MTLEIRETWNRNGKQPRWFVEKRAAAVRRTIEQKMFAHTVPEPNSGCWLWFGSAVKGYGRVWHEGRCHMATHMALRLVGIDVPEGLCALHRCDNPACVNPDHLFIGTHKDNRIDCATKGRAFIPRCPPEKCLRGDAHPRRARPELVVRGETHQIAKLTERDVLFVRSDERPAKELAALLGVSPQLINAIRKRRIWRHVA